MLQKGRSLHIGLNHVDNSAYAGWEIPDLNGCIPDANAMQQLAASQGFLTLSLRDDQATANEVIRLISSFARELESGDIFFLTYSGHGSQIDDTDGDEVDNLDETWVLWDRMLIDDELYQLFSQFSTGVRIFMLSDSCHSGTVARMVFYNRVHRTLAASGTPIPGVRDMSRSPRFRGLPAGIGQEIYEKKKAMYDSYRHLAGRKRDASLGASLILISGCQDSQLSSDGDQNGLFTQTLLDVWNNGNFQGDYRTLSKAIINAMPPYQTPNFYSLGNVSEFASERPFTVTTQQFNPVSSQGPIMGVRGDTTRSRSDSAPDFTIDKQGAPYCVVEFATDISLFGSQANERNPSNFYGTWSESPVLEVSNGFYAMPNSVWNALKSADQIYFRTGTTTSETGWENYRVSTDDGASDGPFLTIVG